MSEADKISAKFEQATGAAKEKLGEVTHSEDMQAEGKLEQIQGEVKEAVENVKGAVKDIFTRD